MIANVTVPKDKFFKVNEEFMLDGMYDVFVKCIYSERSLNDNEKVVIMEVGFN